MNEPVGPEKARRNQAGQFMPGTSGNPAGRPRKAPDPLRERLAEVAPALIEGLIRSAAQGDVSAARILLERCLPALKPQESPQAFDMPGGALTTQADAIVGQAASGELSAGTAATLLTGLGAVARIRESEELRRRVEALEAAIAKP